MDDDKSGKITYREFSGMCREELKMKKSDVPDEELQGAWNALDDDDSGFITAGAPRPAQLSFWLLSPCLQRLLVCSFSRFAFARVPQASSGPS